MSSVRQLLRRRRARELPRGQDDLVKPIATPLTHVNLCALSANTRLRQLVVPSVWRLPASAGGVKGTRPSAVANATLDPVLAAGDMQLRDADASRTVKIYA